MRLTINHITEYSYDEPVPYSFQRLRLTPRSGPGQQVVSWKTGVEGATIEVGYDDHFGNIVHLVEMEGEKGTVRIIAQGEVITEDRAGVLGPHQGNVPLWLYLRDTPRTRPGKLVRELARGVSGDNELARLHSLMKTVHETVAYKPGSTTTDTTAEQALEAANGVCQDHAHIFIAATRLLGMPARYVSGYLMMEDTELQEATHAWAEAHVPGLGWVGFDAANDVCPDARYVRIASGLCYRDCAPVSGIRAGTGKETLSVQVAVSQSQQQSQSQG